MRYDHTSLHYLPTDNNDIGSPNSLVMYYSQMKKCTLVLCSFPSLISLVSHDTNLTADFPNVRHAPHTQVTRTCAPFSPVRSVTTRCLIAEAGRRIGDTHLPA